MRRIEIFLNLILLEIFMKYIILISLFALVNIINAETNADSIKSYRLGEINISGYQSRAKVESSKYDLQYFQIQKTDASSLNQLQMLIPSGRIRINSRGESMLFLRGAGERQLGLFFDGVQMNIPWDNRFDLTFIPTDVIGKLNVNKNAGSILYGPNVLGGAVNITTMERANDGFGGILKFQADNSGAFNTSFTTDGQIPNFNYIANFSIHKSNGYNLSSNVPDSVLYQNKNDDLIINSNMNRISAYLRGEYHISNLSTLGISASYIDGDKGVIPENHNKKARFWRYPELNRLLLTMNFEHKFSEFSETSFRATFWFDKFNQTIDDYKDATYSKDKFNQQQKDEDITMGGRLAYQYQLAQNQFLTAVFNGFTSKHTATISNSLEYSQNTINTGLDYNAEFGAFNVNAGIGLDRNETPLTGLYKESEGFSATDYAAFVNLNYSITDKVGIFGNISRRTRFATMREQYDGALNKFKANPDLKAESGILSEIGTYYNSEDFSVRGALFLNTYSDMITQITLTKQEDSLERKMRVNVGTANIYGVDVSFKANPFKSFHIDGNITYMLTKGEQDGIDILHFDNKPEILGGITLSYKLPYNIDIATEIETTGQQFETIDMKNQKYAKIDASTVLNFRASILILDFDSFMPEIFIRANNIFDAYRLSQRGIPEPGRTISAGVSIKV